MPELLLLAGYLLLSAIMTSVLYCGSANYEAEPNILYDETAGYTGYPANMQERKPSYRQSTISQAGLMSHAQVDMAGRATIFVAHSTQDLADARLVRNLFEDRDHDVLLLRLSQRMTDDFLGTLPQREIRARDWLVVVSSENAQRSSWVEFEETYARERAKPVFYIQLAECSHLSGDDRANCIGTQVSSISRAIRVFMSYHREDMDVARRIAANLTARGFEVWLDLESMPAGANFQKEIFGAIDRTLENGAMVVLVSSGSMEGEWVLQELNYALAQEGRVVPCLVGPQPSNMPAQLQRIQWIDFTGVYEEGFQRLLRALGH